MADESYSLGEVADSLGVTKDEVVRRVHQGEFPGRFLTSEFEMRVPARDVRRALARRPQSPAVQVGGELTVDDAGGLAAWSRERELLEGYLTDREERLEALVREGFGEIHRKLDHLLRRLDALEWDGSYDGLERSSALDDLLSEVRALEHMAGLDGSGD
ncbi:MAG: hypothetical protein AAGD10_00345 [Myxococcota bacterium]